MIPLAVQESQGLGVTSLLPRMAIQKQNQGERPTERNLLRFRRQLIRARTCFLRDSFGSLPLDLRRVFRVNGGNSEGRGSHVAAASNKEVLVSVPA